MYIESNKRTLVKALAYRLVAYLTTSIIVLLTTGNWALALSIGTTDSILKLAVYFLHEKIWNKISWGKIPFNNKDNQAQVHK